MFKRSISLILFVLAFCSVQSQDYMRTPILSKVTATWCPNCGSWGWDFMEELEEEFEDHSAIILGVHHSGDLENSVSDWFSKNLGNTYQPQFFVNNQQVYAGSGNWQSKVTEIRQIVDMVRGETAISSFNLDGSYFDENGDIHAVVDLLAFNKSASEMYLGLYIVENDVINYQSSRSQTAAHPYVLRDVISDNYWGDLYDGTSSQNIHKVYTLDNSVWVSTSGDNANISIVGIMWEKVGNKYIVDNANFVGNLSLLLSADEVLDENLFTITTSEHHIDIKSSDNEKYKVLLANSQGQLVHTGQFTDSMTIETPDIPTGIYVLTISSKDRSHSQQLYLR